MARVYASVGDLSKWLGDYPPSNADILLARASLDVDSALIGVRYQVDDDGMPTTALVIQALNDAVCAQVASWVSAAQAAAKQGSRETWPRLAQLRVDPPPSSGGGCRPLTDDACQALHVAGLSPSRPWIMG